MNGTGDYHHTQRAPLCLLIYTMTVIFLVVGLVLSEEPLVQWLFPAAGLVMLVLAASFHHLTVQDEVDRVSVSFGPLPLFRREIRYDDIVSVEPGRTTILDGWGIHMSLRGGWVWNIWGRDCVVLHLRKGILRVGTDDTENLAAFLSARVASARQFDRGDVMP